MSTIKNGQISLYCHLNKIIKGPGPILQFSALSQKHVRNVRLAAYILEFNQIPFLIVLRIKLTTEKN